MSNFRIAVLAGDGIGREVIDAGIEVLNAVRPAMPSATFQLEDLPAGAGEYLRSGNPLPERTMERCRAADAIFLGAMGLPSVRWPGGTEMAPQLDLREELELFAGIRPTHLFHPSHSPLRGVDKLDFVIVRESTEGMFASRKNTPDHDAPEICDTLRITRRGAERVVRAAFRLAQKRRKHVTLVDKANVLPSMAYFRRIFDQVAAEFPDCKADHCYVDAAALFLVRDPGRFDVMVMENLFGDILSDLAAGLVGGMGMAPSADIGDKHAVFQPAHGSAPDIAGKGWSNPVATILSLAMMLDWLGTSETAAAARQIEAAVARVMANPANASRDLGGTVGTSELTARIVAAL